MFRRVLGLLPTDHLSGLETNLAVVDATTTVVDRDDLPAGTLDDVDAPAEEYVEIVYAVPGTDKQRTEYVAADRPTVDHFDLRHADRTPVFSSAVGTVSAPLVAARGRHRALESADPVHHPKDADVSDIPLGMLPFRLLSVLVDRNYLVVTAGLSPGVGRLVPTVLLAVLLPPLFVAFAVFGTVPVGTAPPFPLSAALGPLVVSFDPIETVLLMTVSALVGRNLLRNEAARRHPISHDEAVALLRSETAGWPPDRRDRIRRLHGRTVTAQRLGAAIGLLFALASFYPGLTGTDIPTVAAIARGTMIASVAVVVAAPLVAGVVYRYRRGSADISFTELRRLARRLDVDPLSDEVDRLTADSE